VQEAVVVMKDIFRKYPSTYEGVIPTLCANLDELDEPEAKASLIWIIGEYADKIENADELLGIFVDSFTEEAYAVQLQTLTAVVKLFLKKPDSAQGVVQRVLNTATKDCDSPDVRDRAYIYWRLLSTDPAAAKAVVLAHRPPISLPRTTVSAALLEELLGEISSLASVYHKPAETFIGQGKYGADAVHRQASNLDDEVSSTQKALQNIVAGQQAENLLDFGDDDAGDGQPSGLAATTISSATPAAANLLQNSSNPLDDLVSIFGGSGSPSPGQQPQQPQMGGLGGLSFGAQPAVPQTMAAGFGAPSPAAAKPAQPAQGQDDLLGLF